MLIDLLYVDYERSEVNEQAGKFMSLMPDFELGLWNAWVFMLPVIAITFFRTKDIG
jgi:hypothetical protein